MDEQYGQWANILQYAKTNIWLAKAIELYRPELAKLFIMKTCKDLNTQLCECCRYCNICYVEQWREIFKLENWTDEKIIKHIQNTPRYNTTWLMVAVKLYKPNLYKLMILQ
jgi:hypothetical protein